MAGNEYKTRDGRDVRIIRIDNGSLKFPLLAEVNHVKVRYTRDGFYRMDKREDPRDIMGFDPRDASYPS